MQARGGRRDSPGALGENRLVAVAVRWLVTPRDVRRQGNVADPFDHLVHVSLSGEPKPAQAVIATTHYFGDKFSRAEIDALTYAHLSARTNQGLPFFR